ncbi:MAG: hypothetical protein UR33_C0004G0051 [Candidatus Woesebacteria bacterium GW2011_GWA2_33_20]|uniref:Uncharacterized protein n=1 Tax=Candidatus Woesebacteria bacterium GW2011_GWB1_33_22 TaxID=1618566 RepID=A0A0G0CNQ0_9BACT|nr:MAG: hypothetical protein UR33_C0004G0051 [Candidatus Woesebacteria bacterium GW2011_GWA2_33_20]KKP45022.1 MAG: hypothetical protein UR35_C0004G0054 [Candidatus Woesebacteria bacterium GW2011_GWB1_33_22]KKP46871.1 MAG: hypothetical protein UR37_C0004G0050 [Microgenomates group bacterium GW2011_GWC1_33_28]KKP50744.1 MAG: hypothetical protein UR41_C0004G0055 [Candidatus Woesebacteria bacterium GW2011_GWA1_33_33]OGM86963.1 MAG: hypothetical protein A2616_00060 [Candidatus Woesebacteria bacteriu
MSENKTQTTGERTDEETRKIIENLSKKKKSKKLNDPVDPDLLNQILENERTKGQVWKKEEDKKEK